MDFLSVRVYSFFVPDRVESKIEMHVMQESLTV